MAIKRKDTEIYKKDLARPRGQGYLDSFLEVMKSQNPSLKVSTKSRINRKIIEKKGLKKKAKRVKKKLKGVIGVKEEHVLAGD